MGKMKTYINRCFDINRRNNLETGDVGILDFISLESLSPFRRNDKRLERYEFLGSRQLLWRFESLRQRSN